MPVFYKDVMLDCGYRVDLFVEKKIIVEIKSVTTLAPIHEAQLLSYLRLSGLYCHQLIEIRISAKIVVYKCDCLLLFSLD